ncbi:hypothetical protein NADFUDRAFT_39529 [Nadsonia fulvescens var. elongata DSM 6958]|uniref:Uncharacterized protein n=1 Tax=Nadsonia fulvescens var. elongata DSM 6958 TaxID=857566 RepID=A0A1E3PT77_9ASCO|nr:hypothetical protein NADFUDRAFT_39529 [Nadsonia fulvescens var. elongata DSM 6958]
MSDLHYESATYPDGMKNSNDNSSNPTNSPARNFEEQQQIGLTSSPSFQPRLDEAASEPPSSSTVRKSFKSQSLNRLFRPDSEKVSPPSLQSPKTLPSRGARSAMGIFAPKAKSSSQSSSLLSKAPSIPSTHGHMTLVPLKRDFLASPINTGNQNSSSEVATTVWKKSVSSNKDTKNSPENISNTNNGGTYEAQDPPEKNIEQPAAVPTPPASEEELEKSGIKLTHRFQAKDFASGNFNWDEDDEEDWDGSIDFKQMSSEISEQVQNKSSAEIVKSKSSPLTGKIEKKTKEIDQGFLELPSTPWNGASSLQVKFVPISQQLREFSEKKSNSNLNTPSRSSYHQPQNQYHHSSNSFYDRSHDNEKRHSFWGEEDSFQPFHNESRRFDHERRTDNFGPPMYESHNIHRRNDGWVPPQRTFDHYDNSGPRARRDSFEDEDHGWVARRGVSTFNNKIRRFSNESSHSSGGRANKSPTTHQELNSLVAELPLKKASNVTEIHADIKSISVDTNVEKRELIAPPKDDIAAILKKQEEVMRIAREKARKRKEEELQREKDHQMEVLRKAKEKAQKLKHNEVTKAESSSSMILDTTTKANQTEESISVQDKTLQNKTVLYQPPHLSDPPKKETPSAVMTEKETDHKKDGNDIHKDPESDSIGSLQRPVWLRRSNLESPNSSNNEKSTNQGLWRTVGTSVKEPSSISWSPINSSSGFPSIYSPHSARSRSTGMIDSANHSIESNSRLTGREKSQSTCSFAGFLNRKSHGFATQSNSHGPNQNATFMDKFSSQIVHSDSSRFSEGPWNKNSHQNNMSTELPSANSSPEDKKSSGLSFSRYTLKDSTTSSVASNSPPAINASSSISAINTSTETKTISSLPSTPGKASKRVFSRFFPSPKVGDADYSNLKKSPKIHNESYSYDAVVSNSSPYFNDPPRISLPRPLMENEKFRRDGLNIPNSVGKLPSLNSIQALQDTIAQRLSSKFSTQTVTKMMSLDLPAMPLISEIPPDCYESGSESDYALDSREPRISLKNTYSTPKRSNPSAALGCGDGDKGESTQTGLKVQTISDDKTLYWNFSQTPSLKVGSSLSNVNSFSPRCLSYKLPSEDYIGTYDTMDSKGFKHEREFKPILTIRVETLQINVPGGNRVSVSRSTGEIVQSKKNRQRDT